MERTARPGSACRIGGPKWLIEHAPRDLRATSGMFTLKAADRATP
jgi:hypothetical protein